MARDKGLIRYQQPKLYIPPAVASTTDILQRLRRAVGPETNILSVVTNTTATTTNITATLTNITPRGTNISIVRTNIAAGSTNIITENVSGSTNSTAWLQIMAEPNVEEEFGKGFSDTFFVAEVVIQNPSTSPVLVYSASMEVPVSYFYSQKDWEMVRTNKSVARHEYFPTIRRPSTFSDILAVFDFQRQSNGRQTLINYLKSAGEIAAGAGVFVGGANYPKAVSFATGIVVPELEKRLLWDIILHAKNLESRSFKEIEEIPSLGAIHRLVFFPRGRIPGIAGNGMFVYISKFDSRHPLQVSGTLINKVASIVSDQTR